MTNKNSQKYRLGLDLGTNSIGWATLALNQENQPYKILDAGVRIFSDGRNPKDGMPLAVARRDARGMRRRRDRFLARKSKLMNCLIRFELMPKSVALKRENKKDEGYNFVYSKPLASLSENEIERIRDEKIYRDLKKKLTGAEGKKEIEKILSEYALETKNGQQKVKNIRLIKKENRFAIISNKQLTLQKKEVGGVEEKIHTKAVVGSNHHIAIWELPKLNFLPLVHLKGKKLDVALDKLSEAEKVKFERFRTHQEKLKNWISKDCEYAVSCTSSFEAAKGDENQFRPHPTAKLLTKIHNGDLMKLTIKNEEFFAKTIKLVPSNDGIALLKHNETGKEVKQIWLSFSKFKETSLTKIFITPTGKVLDFGPILKTKEEK